MVSEASLGRNLSGAFRSHLFLQWGSSSVSDLVRGEDVGGWKNEALEDQSPIEHGRLTNPSHVLFFLPGRAIVPCVNPASKTQSRHFACNREDLRHKEQKGCRVEKSGQEMRMGQNLCCINMYHLGADGYHCLSNTAHCTPEYHIWIILDL